MYFITIDCGTTNSRVYVVDEAGKVYAKATKKVGVRNTSMTGSRDCLRDGLRETVDNAIALAQEQAGITPDQIKAILSSGMITSEIGLMELPHLMAPCDVDRLAANIEKVDVKLTEYDIPVYFVRGIKNIMPDVVEDPFAWVGNADFMRGEETQIAGLLAQGFEGPATVTVLSSHTKFIPVDAKGSILGSLTTTSGQVREAILKETFVGKSVEKRDSADEKPADYFDENVVMQATKWIQQAGIVRCMMLPRFLDVLLKTKWYERELFFDALIAAEDMLSIGMLNDFDAACKERFVFVGLPSRCKLYEFIVKTIMPEASVVSICDTAKVDSLSIDGILNIVKKAGIFA